MLAVKASIAVFFAVVLPPTSPQISKAPIIPKPSGAEVPILVEELVLARSSVSLHSILDRVVQRGSRAYAGGCKPGVHPVRLVPMRRRGKHRAGVPSHEFHAIEGPQMSGTDS
jgi:hypothetical protein